MEDPFTIFIPSGFVLSHESKKFNRSSTFNQVSANTFENLQYLYNYMYGPSDDIVFECTDKTIDLTPYKPWLDEHNIKIKE